MQEIHRLLDQNQDPKIVGKIVGKLSELMTENETIEFVAVQKKPLFSFIKQCLVLTNKRLIFCKPKKLEGSTRFDHFQWEDIANCEIKEGILGARLSIQTKKATAVTIEFLPKSQARLALRFAQERASEIIRQNEREISLKNMNVIYETVHIQDEDLKEKLNQLIDQLEDELISVEEFEIRKAEIISRL